MANITFDGQSFLIDGRRIWVVSASIPSALVPAAEWADRIHAAKLAGFNAVETPVVWSRHETRSGHFDFTGENDIRGFLRLVGDAGMMAVVRLGPFIGAPFDLGGIPPWVADLANARLRAPSGPFLDACSKYINAVADQVRDLQATNPGKAGPIVLVQNEAAWTCGQDDHAAGYLGELHRYIREAGISVPIIGAHNLWTGVEGETDAWSGAADALSVTRQLSEVRPDQPKFITDLDGIVIEGDRDSGTWGFEGAVQSDGALLQRRIAEALAGGSQFNVRPFAETTLFGFAGGRYADGIFAFQDAVADPGATLTESGAASNGFADLRRIVTFASRFGRVFANLQRAFRPVVIDPDAADAHAGAASRSAASIVPCSGSQGTVAFVFAPRHAAKVVSTSLLLSDGTTLPVDLSGQPVVWCLLGVQLSARAMLDYCNLSAFATVGKTFVCFGNEGTTGRLSINGTPAEFVIQGGRTPTIIQIEGTTVVACSLEQIDSTFVTDTAVFIGAIGFTSDGRVVVPATGAGAKSAIRIDSEGNSKSAGADAVKVPELDADRPTLGPWTCASCDEYVTGETPRYASISGPTSLSQLGAPSGYGWYRVTLKPGAARSAKLSAPGSGDRLHVFQNGKDLGVVGVGSGATDSVTVALKKGTTPLVVLAENLGRFCEGLHLAEIKGLCTHLAELTAVKCPPPKLTDGVPIDILAFRSPVWEVRTGDTTLHERVTWTLARRTHPLMMFIDADDGVVTPGRAIVLVNNKPMAIIDHAGPTQLTFDAETIGRGAVVVQLASIPSATGSEISDDPQAFLKAMAKRVSFVEADDAQSSKADWAFAKWEPPTAQAFTTAHRAKGTGPSWWKAPLKVGASAAPLYLELDGLTKGQIYINGRHLARYFATDGAGVKVGPRQRQWIPASWLHAGSNDVMIFDEHGGLPTKCRAVRDTSSRPILASPKA